MTATSTTTPFNARIAKALLLLEMLFLLALTAGTISMIMGNASTVVVVSLIGLAIVFFFSAYKPLNIPQHANEQFGFSALLAFVILPKVMWISCSVSSIGLAFYILKLGNTHTQLLMIGGSTLAITILLLAFLLANGTRYINAVTPMLLRAIPLLIIDFYILFS
jgi:hypothetical protein